MRQALFKTRALQVGQLGLLATFVVAMVAALHPEARTAVRGKVLTDYRQLVSSAQGDLLGDGTMMKVAKIKTRDSIFLEIYRHQPTDSGRMVERIELPDSRDGYFNFNGQAANLALEDIDGDGRAEILAPSFDRDLVGRLNIFKYDQNAKVFARIER